MKNINIENIGNLKFKEDHWECYNIPTNIGNVDLQIDSIEIEKSATIIKIKSIINKIDQINEKAKKYLEQKVPKDEFLNFGDLFYPSIIFENEDDEGSFTIFYSCSNDNEIDCGVEFKEYEPFDLTIGY